MLVLSRDCDTVVRIGPCKVKVLSIRKRHVKLGIDAPRGIQVWREEIRAEPEQPGFRPEATPADHDHDHGYMVPDRVPDRVPRDPFFTLLVEDDPAHARLISEALVESCFMQPRVVGTGQAAIKALLPGTRRQCLRDQIAELPGVSPVGFPNRRVLEHR